MILDVVLWYSLGGFVIFFALGAFLAEKNRRLFYLLIPLYGPCIWGACVILMLYQLRKKLKKDKWEKGVFQAIVRAKNHTLFENAEHNEECPCGSGIKFKKCCIGKYTKGGKDEIAKEKITLNFMK